MVTVCLEKLFLPKFIVTKIFCPLSLLPLVMQGVMEICQLLRTSLTFSRCHHLVDPEPYIHLCEEDICACTHSTNCHCSVFLDYARNCAHEGVILDGWPEESLCSKLIELFLSYLPQMRS